MRGRRLTGGERELARSVFADAIRLERVRLHAGGFGAFAVTLGSHVFLPAAMQLADYAQAGRPEQALLVHELVHVWQFQTRPVRTLRSWAWTVICGGYGPGLPGYCYELPLRPFDRLGLERQARAVEHAFLLGHGWRSRSMPEGLSAPDLAGAPFPVTGSGLQPPWGPPVSSGP